MLIAGNENKKYYAVKVKGKIVSRPELTIALASAHIKSLQVKEHANAQIVQVNGQGLEVLFG